MKLFRKLTFILPVITFFIFNSCAEDPMPSLWEEEPAGLKPVINSIGPDIALAGVTELTIDGANFSTTPEYNFVAFNGTAAEIISATPNQLIVKAPNIVDDTIFVVASVVSSVPVSDTVIFKLLPPYAELKADAEGSDLFTADIVPFGLTTDAQGNIYTSMVEFVLGKGIRKITPTGEIVVYGTMEDFAPKGGETSFHQLNMFQNNTIIGARRVKAIFQITEGVAASVFHSQGLGDIYDIDFDQNLNVWAGGTGIFSVTPAKEMTSFSFDGLVKAVRVFNNYLYVLATVNSDDVIQRMQINSNQSIGSPEEIFNISQSVLPDTGTGKVTGTDFEIAADGDIVLGTTKNIDPIIIVHQDGTFNPLYPGVIAPGTRVLAFAWAPGNYLYLTREASSAGIQSIFRLNMLKSGAPYYGK